MLIELKHLLADYDIILLDEKNYLNVWEVHDTNQDYFVLTEGKRITKAELLESMMTIPDGCDPSSKYCVELRNAGKAIAYLEFYDGLSDPEWIWLSVLIVHKEHARMNIGTDIVQALISISKKKLRKAIMLGVVSNNASAVAFWEKIGFEPINKSSINQRGADIEIITFCYDLMSCK